ncbi:MAG: hypothetical protein ACE15C_10420 [Phycisphaerae bacterium]
MRIKTASCVALLVLAGGLSMRASGQTTRQIIRAEDQPNLLKDDAWQPYAKDAPLRRDGEVFVLDNGKDPKAVNGVRQTVTLNQAAPLPVVASLWSKAQDVDGRRDQDYSLYLDVFYADGEPLWGQIAELAVGTHDWQKAEVKVIPAKPIKEIAFFMLLRSHSGKAMFKQPRLCQVDSARRSAMFDGFPVKLAPAGQESFWVRDVAAGSDFVPFEKGQALGLKLSVTRTQAGNATFHAASLADTTGKDRAVTLIFTSPVAGDSWRWLAGPRKDEPAKAPLEYLTASEFPLTASGRLSKYPFAAVAKADKGQAIGIDMGRPAFFRTAFAAGTGELYVAYDLGLAPEKPSAEIALCTFAFDGAAGFRGAAARYYELFPDYFRCRAPRQGLWMPFYPISKIEGWQDFGFAFKEGNDETQWDDAHDIITFRYTEPMTWWMRMPKDLPRTFDAALAEAKRLADKGDRGAAALFTSGHYDRAGRLVCQLKREPWCDGAVWSMNSSPGIDGDITDFKNKWNPGLKEKLYGKGRKGDLDGEYIDSSEGYVTAELDFRREHFAAARTPLTFSAGDFKPAVFRGLISQEYVRAIADDVHGMGKLMMANGAPGRLCWLAPWLDVMGTETDWNRRRKWSPMSDEELLFRRVLCGPKPYCFLMNTDFGAFPHELVEKYMKRSLAYGMFPGFFSHNASEGHYFSQPKLYNRDRDLFRKYVPLCKLVAQAGWRPVTGAHSDDPKVYVERFGNKHLTVFNDSGQKKDATITITAKPPAKVKELLSGTEQPTPGGKFKLTLNAEDVAVIEIQ